MLAEIAAWSLLTKNTSDWLEFQRPKISPDLVEFSFFFLSEADSPSGDGLSLI